MLCKPPIELGGLLCREREFRTPPGIVQTSPECHGQLCTLARREFQ